MVEGGKGSLSKEVEAQKGVKQAKVTQILVDKRGDSQVGILAWTPAIILDGALLPAEVLIRNF